MRGTPRRMSLKRVEPQRNSRSTSSRPARADRSRRPSRRGKTGRSCRCSSMGRSPDQGGAAEHAAAVDASSIETVLEAMPLREACEFAQAGEHCSSKSAPSYRSCTGRVLRQGSEDNRRAPRRGALDEENRMNAERRFRPTWQTPCRCGLGRRAAGYRRDRQAPRAHARGARGTVTTRRMASSRRISRS